jgi:hypothetical protein
MRLILGALAAVLAALSFPSASFADATNPFSGTWSTTVDGVAPGSLTLGVISAATGASDYQGLGGQPCAQPTTYYSGNFSNDGTTGTIVGCTLSTDHLVGRFEADNAPAGQSATGAGDITYTAPNSFSGTLDYGGSSYPYTGKLNTSSPPPTSTPPTSPPTIPPTSAPPTSTPPSTPSGSSPATPTTPSGASPTPAGSSGSSPSSSSQPGSRPAAGPSRTPLPGSGLIEVAEPAPGNSATVVSPNPLTASPTAAFGVSESTANFAGTTIVGPGELQRQGSGETLACWLIGPGAAQVPPGLYGKNLGLGFFRGRLHAADAYTACAGVAQAVGAAAAAAASATAAAAATPAPAVGSGCPARRIEVAIQVANGLIVGAQPLPSPVLGPLAVTYTCALGKGGSLEVSVGGPHAGGLRQALGNQLRLGVLRAADVASRDATLTFSFGPSWTGTWKTTHGAMRLTQTGGLLTGTYAACGGKATITGRVTGRSFDGTWSEGCNAHGGRLDFTLAVDGQTFKGKWGYGGAAPTLSWSATRRVAGSPPGPV